MVAVPVRGVVAVLAATLIATVPLPLPLAPLVTVSHGAAVAAVQAQPAELVTATLAESPAASALKLGGAIEYVHVAAAWLTVKVWPAMVAVPVRVVVAVLAATLIATVPLPLPLAPPGPVSHGAALAAVQAQPIGLVAATLAAWPAATALALVGLIA